METVHKDEDVEIIHSRGRPLAHQAGVPVTFSSWSVRGEGEPFGRGLFEKHGFEVHYVRSRHNHWWHVPALPCLLETILWKTRNSFFYGSSMGGYGALYYSRLLAVPAIALSPQTAVRPETLPKDVRWPRIGGGSFPCWTRRSCCHAEAAHARFASWAASTRSIVFTWTSC